jgi:hypothetical protein
VEDGEPSSAPGVLRPPKQSSSRFSCEGATVAGHKNPGPPRRWLLVLVTKGGDLSGACCS